jgi:hypothetical protein
MRPPRTSGSARRRLLAGGTALITLAALTVVGAPAAQAAVPSNDDISAAVAFSSVPVTFTVNTEAATVAPGETLCAREAQATVWYAFTPTSSGRYAFDTVASDYDTDLAIYSGSPGHLTQLDCEYYQYLNNSDWDWQARLALALTAGTTYYIQVGTGFEADWLNNGRLGGNLALTVSVAPPLFDYQVVVNRRGSVTADGWAEVSGTIACNSDTQIIGGGSVVLTQRRGRTVVSADDYWEDFGCTSTPQAWSLRSQGDSGTFRPGPATVTLFLGACDPYSCGRTEGEHRVHLDRVRR